MSENEQNQKERRMSLEDRPVDFRTIMILYILLGIGVGLTIHFIVLSSPAYNWISG